MTIDIQLTLPWCRVMKRRLTPVLIWTHIEWQINCLRILERIRRRGCKTSLDVIYELFWLYIIANLVTYVNLVMDKSLIKIVLKCQNNMMLQFRDLKQ